MLAAIPIAYPLQNLARKSSLLYKADIFNYLVKLLHLYKMFKAFKSLDAYKYFECGFVNCLGRKQINNKTLIVVKVCITEQPDMHIV